MGKCIKCGCQFVGTPENPPADGLCKYCQIAELQSQLAVLKLENQQLVNQLTAMTNTVTALCQAIDPDCKHGPETEKLCAYATKTRRLALDIASSPKGNPHYVHNKSREIRQHLDFEQPTNGGFMTLEQDFSMHAEAKEMREMDVQYLRQQLDSLKLEKEKLVELVGRVSNHVIFHLPTCGNGDCTCGLTALRAEIERVKGANPQTNFNQT